MKALLTFLLALIVSVSFARTYSVSSPDGRLVYEVTIGDKISFAAFYKGKTIIDNSGFALQFLQSPLLGSNMEVTNETRVTINETWKTVVSQYASITNNANELSLMLREKAFPARELQLVLRAYNDGVAFRYVIPDSFKNFGPTTPLIEESTNFSFNADYTIWAANYGSYTTHQESEFNKTPLSSIGLKDIIGLPLLVQVDPDLYAAITEANLTDWAGMYLGVKHDYKAGESVTLSTLLSPLPNSENKVIVKPGSKSPWRVIMVGEKPGDLIESTILENLNEPCAIKDPSWIKPGISAWDNWWSGEVKMDTETILKYIDLAADMGWEYMLIDWHWYGAPIDFSNGATGIKGLDITKPALQVDMPKILDYAKAKKIDLLLWIFWEHMDAQLEEAFVQYEKWGIKGVKIDFMARDDQEMVNWYEKVVKLAAEHHLTVDFHGAYKPTGWTRTYPNLLTREGVMGNEYSKWSTRITPEHTTTLPFTRMLAGQMDFTPGAFLNKAMGQFHTATPAEVMGTRSNQLAMFVVFYSPLTVACDHPDNYKNQPGIEFLKEVPTVWDDTKVLNGSVGEFITMARKNGGKWYLGSMTNSEARSLEIDLTFLGEGKWELHYFKDAADASINATHLDMGVQNVTATDKLKIDMAPGGGYAGYFEKK